MIRVFDAFSGIGGFRSTLERVIKEMREMEVIT